MIYLRLPSKIIINPLYPERLSFITEGEIKTFHDKQKQKRFMATNQALKKLRKGILHTEEDKGNQENTANNKSH
jgi:hypothetical protein